MMKKWLIFFAVLMCYGSVKATQVTWWDYEYDDPNRKSTPADSERCNATFCNLPCPGSMPPPYCPANMPTCNSGCVCMNLCESRTVICFLSEYCKETRRFLKNVPFVPRMTPNNQNEDQF